MLPHRAGSDKMLFFGSDGAVSAAAGGEGRQGRPRGESRAGRLELQAGQEPEALAEHLRRRPEVE